MINPPTKEFTLSDSSKYNQTHIGPKQNSINIKNVTSDAKRCLVEKIKTKFINPLSIAPHRKQSNISLKSMKISPFLKINETITIKIPPNNPAGIISICFDFLRIKT